MDPLPPTSINVCPDGGDAYSRSERLRSGNYAMLGVPDVIEHSARLPTLLSMRHEVQLTCG
jgi:hypothetical protein